MATNGGVLPRVFISSVVEGFEAYRQAARDGVEAAGGIPILVNEDFPSLAVSSRNACLDAVESSDIYAAIIGSRGGWTTPSGRLVVEEEYLHARQHNLPTLVFIQDGNRDADANRLVRHLSDYVDGRFRVQFNTPEDLRTSVERALRNPIQLLQVPPVSPSRVNEHLRHPHRMANETALHFILVPERAEEMVHPARFESDDFRHDLYEVALGREVRLLSHEAPKAHSLRRDSAIVHQNAASAGGGGTPEVRLELTTFGVIGIDAAITGRRPRDNRLARFQGMVIERADVEETLRAAFAFSSAMFERLDPYRRHERFIYGVGLTGLQYRTWVEEVRPTNRMTMTMRQHPEPHLLFPEPRTIGRSTLHQPEQEVERIVTYARHDLSQAP